MIQRKNEDFLHFFFLTPVFWEFNVVLLQRILKSTWL